MSYKLLLLEEPRTTVNNYKKISMYLSLGISCIWKCSECFSKHYKDIKEENLLEATTDQLIEEYIANPFVEAVVIAGLEPFDNYKQMYNFIKEFREHIPDDIVIFTGYRKFELISLIEELSIFDNIYIKLGRYIPNKPSIYNEKLGITLASDNQTVLKL